MKVIWSKKAYEELADIYAYYHLMVDVQKAEEIQDQIYLQIEKICVFPK
jgi:plasmid stabilization system protein ParE